MVTKNNPGDLLVGLQTLNAISGGASESRITTQEQISFLTRVKLPVFHALTIMISFCGIFAGIILMTWSIDWLFELGWDPGFFILAWLGLILVVYLGIGFVKNKLGQQNRTIQMLAITLAIVGIGLMVGTLIATARDKFGWQLIALILGAGMLLGSSALLYNQSLFMVRPYWPRSPWEEDVAEILLPALRSFLIGEPVQPQPNRLIPVYHNEQVTAIRAENVKMTVEDGGVLMHPDDANFLEFIEMAASKGLSRKDWLQAKPKRILPTTQTEVTRTVYDAQIDRMEQWGFVIRGGDGVSTTWRIPAEKAIQIIREEIYMQGST